MALPISACLITRNEADRLPRTLAALQGHVAETIVHDGESEDATAAIARAAGATVVVRPWPGYVAARQALLQAATQPWVLMIDADEVLDAAFWTELGALGFPSVDVDGFAVNRRMVYLGRPLRHAWQPDWKLALFRADRATVVGGAVHESILVPGAVQRLRAPLWHYSYRSISDHVARMTRYATLAAADLDARGVVPHWWDVTLRPAWHAVRQLLVRGAWRDGTRGWLAAAASGWNAYLRYALLYERRAATGDAKAAPR